MADLSVLMPVVSGAGIFLLVLLGLAGLFKAFYYKVKQGTALMSLTSWVAIRLLAPPSRS